MTGFTPPRNPALIDIKLLRIQWSDVPIEVYNEVRDKMWDDYNFGNDHYYYSWCNAIEEREAYPETAKYLDAHNVTECLIHFWW